MGCKLGSSPQGPQTHLCREEQPMMANALKEGVMCYEHPSKAEDRGGAQTKPQLLHLIDGKQFKCSFTAVQGALIPGMT